MLSHAMYSNSFEIEYHNKYQQNHFLKKSFIQKDGSIIKKTLINNFFSLTPYSCDSLNPVYICTLCCMSRKHTVSRSYGKLHEFLNYVGQWISCRNNDIGAISSWNVSSFYVAID